MLMVFLITCFIPDIQHPILNISGEAGTGKSTISRLIKDLVDPSKAPMNDFSDGEDGIRLPLSQNHLTVFDNIEKMPPKLNALFCRAVTGGETIQRKFYTNNKTVAIPLNSIVIMNGISSFIRKEDLMSRTVFLQTQPLKTISMSGKLLNSYHSDKAEILAGIFDTLSNAMNIIEHVTLSESYRMMEFATWGYAIAEALGKGNGKTFMRLLKRNEALQLQETHANEPLITLISNYMTMRKGEEVDKLTSSFYEEIMRHADTYLGSGSEHMKRMLPKRIILFLRKSTH